MLFVRRQHIFRAINLILSFLCVHIYDGKFVLGRLGMGMREPAEAGYYYRRRPNILFQLRKWQAQMLLVRSRRFFSLWWPRYWNDSQNSKNARTRIRLHVGLSRGRAHTSLVKQISWFDHGSVEHTEPHVRTI